MCDFWRPLTGSVSNVALVHKKLALCTYEPFFVPLSTLSVSRSNISRFWPESIHLIFVFYLFCSSRYYCTPTSDIHFPGTSLVTKRLGLPLVSHPQFDFSLGSLKLRYYAFFPFILSRLRSFFHAGLALHELNEHHSFDRVVNR